MWSATLVSPERLEEPAFLTHRPQRTSRIALFAALGLVVGLCLLTVGLAIAQFVFLAAGGALIIFFLLFSLVISGVSVYWPLRGP